MYEQSKLSELIRFARVDAGSTVIDVYPGDGGWTRLFSDTVGPEGRVYSFVPAEVAHFSNDPVGRMRALAKEPGRENVEVVSAELVALPEATQPAELGPGRGRRPELVLRAPPEERRARAPAFQEKRMWTSALREIRRHGGRRYPKTNCPFWPHQSPPGRKRDGYTGGEAVRVLCALISTAMFAPLE